MLTAEQKKASLPHKDLASQDTQQYAEDISQLITSPDIPRVDLGLKYLPSLLAHIDSLAGIDEVAVGRTYQSFREIILTAPGFNSEQKLAYVQTVSQNDLSIYGTFGQQIAVDSYFQTKEWLQRHAFKMLGLSPAETKNIILENWQNVSTYFTDLGKQSQELTLDTLRNISQLATDTILPSFAQGFRFDPIPNSLKPLTPILKEIEYKYKIFPARGIPVDQLEGSIEKIVHQANHLISTEADNHRFALGIASLAADYIAAHPHSDGNGTKSLFFIDACMVLRGEPPLSTRYETDIDQRALQVLRGNKMASTWLNLKSATKMMKSSLL